MTNFIRILLFFGATAFTSCVSAQPAVEVVDKKVDFLDILWKINKDEMYTVDTESHHFYKLVIIKLSSGESQLEGDVLDQPYLLIGEYGEYPDGVLYKLPSCYDFKLMAFDSAHLAYSYGPFDKREEASLGIQALVPKE